MIYGILLSNTAGRKNHRTQIKLILLIYTDKIFVTLKIQKLLCYGKTIQPEQIIKYQPSFRFTISDSQLDWYFIKIVRVCLDEL